MRLPASIKAFGITRALDYLERDPDANLPRLMEWVDKYTEERLSPAYRELFHKAMTDPENNWHRLIKSMYTDIDNRVLKKIFENFVIHGGLLEWPERSAAGKLNQEDAPWSVLIDPSFPCAMDCAGCGASIYGVRPSLEFDSMDEAVERRKAQGCHLFIVSSGDPLAKEQEAIALFGNDPRVYQTTVKEFYKNESGQVCVALIAKLKSEVVDGRRQMVPTGEEYTVDCDLVLIAAGFTGCEPYVADAFGVELTARGTVADVKYATADPKVFACGDMRRGQSLVVWALREGRDTAAVVDEKLMGYTNL